MLQLQLPVLLRFRLSMLPQFSCQCCFSCTYLIYFAVVAVFSVAAVAVVNNVAVVLMTDQLSTELV